MTSSADRTPDVLVTLADRHYLAAAKQLFSSAYHDGGWRGDYLLLAHDVPEAELGWFRDRGILVHSCVPLTTTDLGGMPAVLGSKLYVFAPEFRRWRTIVYIDADALIRGSLDGLGGLEGFHAVRDWNPSLGQQIASRAELVRRSVPPTLIGDVQRELGAYSRAAPAFCAGFLVIDSRILDDDLFPSLVRKMHRFGPLSRFGDQLIVNLQFHRRWRRLSPVYHLLLWNGRPPWPLRAAHSEALVFHFVGANKPWLPDGPFREEWLTNLARADEIDTRSIPAGRRWDEAKMERVSRRLSRSMSIGVLARQVAGLARRLR